MVQIEDVTIVIPAYNNLRHLRNCYESIRYHYPSLKLILIDDGSTDGTDKWLRSLLDPCIEWFRSEERLGHTIQYDAGISKATTQVVGILHADMIVGPNYLENCLKHLKKKTVVCATRVEPPLHPGGLEKIVKNFGLDFDSLDTTRFYQFCLEEQKYRKDQTTRGIFAPWMLYKEDFESIGGHDWGFAPYPHEDSIVGSRYIFVIDSKKTLEILTIEELFERYEEYVEVRSDLKEIIDFTKHKIKLYTAAAKKEGRVASNRIQKVIRKTNTKKLLHVRTKWGETICTEDHSLLDKELNCKKASELNSETVWYPEKIELVDSYKKTTKDNFDLLDYIDVDNKEEVEHNLFTKFGFVDKFAHNLELVNVCEFLGFFVAEGWTTGVKGNKEVFGVCSSNLEYLNYFKEKASSLFKKSFGDHYTTSYYDKGVLEVYAYTKANKVISKFLSKLVGSESGTKQVPKFILNLPIKYQKAFLYGYLVGDGYLGGVYSRWNKSKSVSLPKELIFNATLFPQLYFKFSTKSPKLAVGVNYLLKRCFKGLKTTIRSSTLRKDTRIYEIDSCTHIHKKNKDLEIIDLGVRDCYVYDLEVEDSHTFVDGMGMFGLHNSDLFNRWDLAKYQLVQSRDAFVYHLTCRGHRWTGEIGKDTEEFKFFEKRSREYYIRKWGSWMIFDEYHHPIAIPVYSRCLVLSQEVALTEEERGYFNIWFNDKVYFGEDPLDCEEDIVYVVDSYDGVKDLIKYIPTMNRILHDLQKENKIPKGESSFSFASFYIYIKELKDIAEDLIHVNN